MERTERTLARAALILACTWLAAGSLFKLFAGSPQDLPPVVRDLYLGEDLTFRLAIAVELAVVFTAILRPRWGWLLLALTFVVFDVVLAQLVASGAASCGCFGSKVKIPPLVMMGIDTALLGLLLLSRPWSARLAPIGPRWLLPALVVAGAVFPFFQVRSRGIDDIDWSAVASDGEDAGGASGKAEVSGARWINLHPEEWIGKTLFETKLPEALGWSEEEVPLEGLLVFYRWTCEHCAAHLMELAQTELGQRPVVLIRVPEEWDTPDNGAIHVWPEGPHVRRVELPGGASITWNVDTPADVELEGGIVVRARENVPVDEH